MRSKRKNERCSLRKATSPKPRLVLRIKTWRFRFLASQMHKAKFLTTPLPSCFATQAKLACGVALCAHVKIFTPHSPRNTANWSAPSVFRNISFRDQCPLRCLLTLCLRKLVAYNRELQGAIMLVKRSLTLLPSPFAVSHRDQTMRRSFHDQQERIRTPPPTNPTPCVFL